MSKPENAEVSPPTDFPPFEDIIDVLRMRRGLEPDDESEDALISEYTPRKALQECCAWHIGDSAWSGEFLRWAGAAGYSIKENAKADRSTD